MMLFNPAQLGREGLDRETLAADKKACRRFGPCGVGEKALYLNSFYIDRRYYVPFASVQRVFKRVAMSKGGFSGKGMFASMAYLVVEYDDGSEKQCNFKYEEQVDQMLAYIGQKHPGLPLMSREAAERVAARERERAMRPRPQLTDTAQSARRKLEDGLEYLQRAPQKTLELSQANQRKRAFLQSNPAYRWIAMVITLMGIIALVFGIGSIARYGMDSFAPYVALFGFAAIFMFSGLSVLPTARNNKKAILSRADRALADMENYLKDYPNFPTPARYAHPIVLQRMLRVVEEGRAQTCAQALDAVKEELKTLNRDVQVEQDEYDEVVAVKPLFLNENYR